MTPRAIAVTELGYTEKQAEFLEVASLQSGYFLRRHINDFLGRRCGALGQTFIDRALAKRHINLFGTFGNRHVYHVVGQGIFRALSDQHNRNRRVHRLATVKRRLMALDFCLSKEAARWLLTEREKTQFFLSHNLALSDLPSEQFGSAERYFVDKQPIAVDEHDIPTLVFVDEGLRGISGWERFLKAHRGLLQKLTNATVVYAGVQPAKFVAAERVFRRLVTGATDAGSFDLVRIRRFFESRRLFEARDYSTFDQPRLDQLREDRRVFSGDHVEKLYSTWISVGNVDLPAAAPSGISMESHILKHRYEWISPIYGEERRECDALDSIAG